MSKVAPNKFRDWLLADSGHHFVELRPNTLAIEVLQYLAFETVAQIVDMCLLVKQGHRREPLDAVSALLTTMKMKNPDYPMFQLKEPQQQFSSSTGVAGATGSSLSSPTSALAESTLLLSEQLIVPSSTVSTNSEQQQPAVALANKAKQSPLLSCSGQVLPSQPSPISSKRKKVSSRTRTRRFARMSTF